MRSSCFDSVSIREKAYLLPPMRFRYPPTDPIALFPSFICPPGQMKGEQGQLRSLLVYKGANLLQPSW